MLTLTYSGPRFLYLKKPPTSARFQKKTVILLLKPAYCPKLFLMKQNLPHCQRR